MKRVISLSIILIVLLSIISSCSLLPEDLKFNKVNFYVDGQLYDSKTVSVGQTVSEPKVPQKENQIFIGWGTSGAVAYKFDFSTKIITDIDLHAYFTIDAVSLTNMITTKTMKSIVTIKSEFYKGTIEVNVSQGSGIVVDVSGGYCYVLTNNHVIENEIPNSKQVISVEDPWGNVYEAKVYKNPSKADYAKSEDYDLALIYFKYLPESEITLEEIEFAEDPAIEEYVASLGTPAGLQNAITYGRVIDYQPVNAEEGSSMEKLTFDIILHDAPIDHGSSGGALINTKGQLVGVNFAGYGEGKYGCSIPISKVLEFMNLYVY